MSGEKKNSTKIKLAVIIIVVAVCISGIGVGSYWLMQSLSNSQKVESILKNSEQETFENIGSTNTEDSKSSSSGVTVTDVSGVVENVMPSIVAITSTTIMEQSNSYENDIYGYFFGDDSGNGGKYESQAAGSGFIVDQTSSELLIVTNNHVVEDADKVVIQFYGQKEKESVQGTIKGTDSNKDVAVVAVKLKDIPSDIRKNIKVSTLGDSDSVKVGEGVIAIGNALGYGQSVTSGVVSAVNREIASDEKKSMKYIQMDAAINGGNSGGALLNAKGEVIGINVAKYSSNGSSTTASIEGMSFAIPISSVKSVISELEKAKTRTKVKEEEQGYLGIRPYTMNEEDSEMYSIPTGVYVREVYSGTPAEKAGIKKGDVITKFGSKTVSSSDDLQKAKAYYKAGEKVKITIASRSEGYKTKEITVKLAKQPSDSSSNGGSSDDNAGGNSDGGSSIEDYFFGNN